MYIREKVQYEILYIERATEEHDVVGTYLNGMERVIKGFLVSLYNKIYSLQVVFLVYLLSNLTSQLGIDIYIIIRYNTLYELHTALSFLFSFIFIDMKAMHDPRTTLYSSYVVICSSSLSVGFLFYLLGYIILLLLCLLFILPS